MLFWDHFPHTFCSLSEMTNISYKIMFLGLKRHTGITVLLIILLAFIYMVR